MKDKKRLRIMRLWRRAMKQGREAEVGEKIKAAIARGRDTSDIEEKHGYETFMLENIGQPRAVRAMNVEAGIRGLPERYRDNSAEEDAGKGIVVPGAELAWN